MNEVTLYAKILQYGSPFLAAFILWLCRRMVSGWDKRIEALESNSVSNRTLESFKDQLKGEHVSNTDKFSRIESRGERIEDGLAQVHGRIDDLFKLLLGRK